MNRTKTILIIEDNLLNMELATELLELENWLVLQAENAHLGIHMARSKQPDLILMDIKLPGMDGLSATRKLKEDPKTKDIKVVAFTSHAMKSDYEKAMEVGCDGFITKPIDVKKFTQEIRMYLT